MIARILSFSVHQRWLVALLAVAAAAFGGWSMTKLPIDAVPDITNKQVQINTIAPALSPRDIEKQVTYPLETALAGIPGLEYTRSFSRNGFSQITSVFDDKLDFYFARQQINERLIGAKASLPPGAEPRMGPISTGLGEIYIWTVDYRGLAKVQLSRMENRVGRAMGAISPLRASVSTPVSSARPTCALCRIGSFVRGSRPCLGLPASPTSSSTPTGARELVILCGEIARTGDGGRHRSVGGRR